MRGDINTLRVVRSPEALQFWINNSLVAVMTEAPFPGGAIGVAASGGPDQVGPARLIADNFRVEIP